MCEGWVNCTAIIQIRTLGPHPQPGQQARPLTTTVPHIHPITRQCTHIATSVYKGQHTPRHVAENVIPLNSLHVSVPTSQRVVIDIEETNVVIGFGVWDLGSDWYLSTNTKQAMITELSTITFFKIKTQQLLALLTSHYIPFIHFITI